METTWLEVKKVFGRDVTNCQWNSQLRDIVFWPFLMSGKSIFAVILLAWNFQCTVFGNTLKLFLSFFGVIIRVIVDDIYSLQTQQRSNISGGLILVLWETLNLGRPSKMTIHSNLRKDVAENYLDRWVTQKNQIFSLKLISRWQMLIMFVLTKGPSDIFLLCGVDANSR